MTIGRELERAARDAADQQSERIAAVPTDQILVLTVTSVVAGASPKGNAVVSVSWRGEDRKATDYGSSYTPAVGDRVVCAYKAEGQLIVIDVLAG